MDLRKLKIFIVILLVWVFSISDAQIVINEASNRNETQIWDEDGENKDWFEIYNNSDEVVNLGGWSISDDAQHIGTWNFPHADMQPRAHLLVFASGKNRGAFVEADRWESPVLPTDVFHYLLPDENTPASWNTLAYDPSGWGTGNAGFGYGDDDDNTLVPEGTAVVYVRKNFTIPDTSAVINALCHADYDDGFVAYLNGVEICRSPNIGTLAWDSYTNSQHEAAMIEGGYPDQYAIDRELLYSAIREGDNVFAIEVHNVSGTSSDLTIIPFLSFGIAGETSYFPPAPSWVNASLNTNLHTDFKLSLRGDSLFLYKNNTLQDSLVVARTEINYSTGRTTDGAGETAIFTNPTPGTSNNSSTAYTEGYEPYPNFNHSSGFYSDSIQVSLLPGSTTADVFYTTNGEMPTRYSEKYDGTPIWVTESSVIRAKSFSTVGKMNSLVSSSTYFIDEDYTLPVLSVITDPDNLYGESGIFTNWRESWNKACFFELFDTTKTLVYRQEAGIQVDGGAGGSRSHPQTSFRVEPGHSVYGGGDMRYSLFPDRPERNVYSSFYVRNGSNQYLILPHKDATEVKGMSKNTYNYYSAYRPIAVHINGAFFGIYELREKINSNFLEHNLGYDIDSLDLIGVSYFKGQTLQATEGTIDGYLEDWNRFLGMDENAAGFLDEVDEFLDIDNYSDYIIGQLWIGNRDWPFNNIKAWRCATTDYRWQFALIDLEWALRPHEWTDATFDAIQYVNESGNDNQYSGFWYKMMQNNEYKHRFINRFADVMNTSYLPDNLLAIEQEMWDEVSPMMHLEYERWGGSDIEAQMSNYTSNHNIFRSELSARSAHVKNHIINHYNLTKKVRITLDVNDEAAGCIKVSTIRPDTYKWQGDYFTDIPIPFKAIPKKGYIFSHWDESPYISDTHAEEFTATLTHSYVNFTAHFVAGNRPFNGITISEINYKDAEDYPTADWFEIFNSTDADLDLTGWYCTDSDPLHRYDFDDNTTIGSGERLVVTSNQKLFSIIYPDLSSVSGDFLFGLNRYADEIRLFNNNDELVVSVKYSNLYPWPLNDNLEGRTLELLDPNGNMDDPDNWFAGCPLGSPGAAYTNSCQYILGMDEEVQAGAEAENLVLRAYPNPVGDQLTLEISLNQPVDHFNIKVYNMQGSLIREEAAGSLPHGSQTIQLDLSGIQSTQMLFIVVSGSGYYETVKVIKQ